MAELICTKAFMQEGFQQMLDLHRNNEKILGGELHPAARKASFTTAGIADDDCKFQ
jgi:hypothetical protein